ncbi:MAG: hypothetical protein ACYC1M_05285 [Armatimonadota bacterium]
MNSWMENPIFVKFLRSQLRPGIMVPAVVGVALFAFAIMLVNEPENALVALMSLQALIVVAGASQTASAAAGARETGMMDLHRITPMTASQLTMGFWLGPSVLTWLLAATVTPFIIALTGFRIEFWGYLIVMVTCGLLWQALGLVLGLYPNVKSGQAGSMVFVIAFALGMAMMGSPMLQCLTPFPMFELLATKISINQSSSMGLWQSSDSLIMPMLLLHHAVFGVILWLMARRRMHNPLSGPIGKPMAISVFVIISAFVALDYSLLRFGSWYGNQTSHLLDWYTPLAAIQLLLGTFFGTSLAVTKGAWLKGLHRLKHIPEKANPHWSDTALNGSVLAAFCVVIVAFSVATVMSPTMYLYGKRLVLTGSDIVVPLMMAFGVCCNILSISFLRQAFRLRQAKGGDALFVLWLFIIWALPMFFAASHELEYNWNVFYYISPIAQIMSASSGVHSMDDGLLMFVPAVVMAACAAFMAYSLNQAKEHIPA